MVNKRHPVDTKNFEHKDCYIRTGEVYLTIQANKPGTYILLKSVAFKLFYGRLKYLYLQNLEQFRKGLRSYDNKKKIDLEIELEKKANRY